MSEFLVSAMARTLGGQLLDQRQLGLERDGIPVRVSLEKTRRLDWVMKVIAPLRRAAPAVGDDLYRRNAEPRVEGLPLLVLRPQDGLDRLGGRLGLNRELETGDSGFDQRVYVITDAPHPVVGLVLASREARAAVLQLLDLGCRRVRIGGERAQVMIRFQGSGERLLALGERLVAQVAALSAGLPSFEGERTYGPRWIDRLAPLLGPGLLAIGLFTFLTGALRFPLEENGPAWRAAAAGLLAWLAIVPAAYLLARGRSRGLATFLLLVLPLLPGLPVASAAGLLVANGALDRGAGVSYRVEILDKQERQTSRRTQRYLRLGGYAGRAPSQVEVDAEQYQAARVRGDALILIRPGRLGLRWIAGVRLTP